MTDLEKFIISRWMYSIGEPIITDPEYTILFEAIKQEYPDNPYVNRSWSSDPCPVELLNKYGYSSAIRDIVLSDKTESIPSINNWGELKSVFGNLNEEATLSYKHDGWNIQASYYNGELINIQTRGRASDAMCADNLKHKIPTTIPRLGKYRVCFEATVPNSKYKILKSRGARSQRGAVSTCLANSDYTDLLSLSAFSIIGDEQVLNPFPTLEEWGFKTAKWTTVNNYAELLKTMTELSDSIELYDEPTDGLVLRGSITRAIRLLHWEEPIYKSYVVGYEESYGAHRVGVKVRIRDIEMRNSTQHLVNCTNYQRVIDNNLRKGYPIAYTLTSAAIADLDEESTRLLQAEWEGREDEYRKTIDASEDAKRSTI